MDGSDFVMPNVSSGADRQKLILISTSFSISLATLSVMGRFASRKMKGLTWGPDDWTLFTATLILWALFGIEIHALCLGVGRHVWDLPPTAVIQANKLLYFYHIFYVVTPPLVKISLLLFYRRLFVSRILHCAIWIMLGICTAWLVAMLFTSIFSCKPISGYWDPTVQAICFDYKSYSIAYCATDIVTDIMVWVLPVPEIWRLGLKPSQKLIVTSIFALGLFAWACTLGRLFAAIVAMNASDSTWNISECYIWSIVEPSIGILCASLPTLRVFFVRLSHPFYSQSRPASWGSQPSDTTEDSVSDSSRGRKLPNRISLDEQLRSLDPREASSMAVASRSSSVPSLDDNELGAIVVRQEVDITHQPRFEWA